MRMEHPAADQPADRSFDAGRVDARSAWSVRRQHDARGELLVERSEADGEFGDLNRRAFAAADAAGVAPRQEFGIARYVGHQLEELHGTVRDDTPLAMTGNGQAGPLKATCRRAPRAAGRNRRPRDSSTVSTARPTPSGSPWRGPWTQARRTRPASRSGRWARAWASAAGTGRRSGNRRRPRAGRPSPA